MKEIDSSKNNFDIFIIPSQARVGLDLINYKYSGKVYEDDNKIILNELNHCYTPLLVLINSKKEIISSYFITPFDTADSNNKFLKEIL